MSFGKMNQRIQIVTTVNRKDSSGFVMKQDEVLASVRAYKEDKNATEKWMNLATFSSATCLFRFRVIPNLKVTTEMVILSDGERYQITSVENVRNRGMYLEVLTSKVEVSADG
ncbi:phage head closure protein [Listeria monocytogenes]|uniref:phage head closure protein n=1 Tax=Enterococcus TaxID=1350 RepID=UPI0010F240DA|nr:head-tail adaptor protein [Listeria monocytogenes]MCD1849283.1 phage head closure protein [Listeria monocytogenes]MCD1852224.1 phage head closure protein [Listeria monocytogenes]MCD1858085.1 phage head closure protein [Listeria monocytogenes]HED6497168.1 phage head closure protein [Listeria monocytogenes]